MEVHLAPGLQSRLVQLAADQGRNAEELVQEAIERLVDYDSWLLQEVERGLAAADRGEFVDHEVIKKRLDERYSG
jgi:predicted transcriptional regulator